MAEASEASQDQLQQEAEAHLRWLLEESGEFPELPDLDQLEPDQIDSMGGGVDAATYLVKSPNGDVVVKLNNEGLEAEARALRSWKPYTDRVPEVLGVGTVPSSGEPPIKYLLLAALKNDDGDVIETADKFLERSQQRPVHALPPVGAAQDRSPRRPPRSPGCEFLPARVRLP